MPCISLQKGNGSTTGIAKIVAHTIVRRAYHWKQNNSTWNLKHQIVSVSINSVITVIKQNKYLQTSLPVKLTTFGVMRYRCHWRVCQFSLWGNRQWDPACWLIFLKIQRSRQGGARYHPGTSQLLGGRNIAGAGCSFCTASVLCTLHF